jgi:hypothetical protein
VGLKYRIQQNRIAEAKLRQSPDKWMNTSVTSSLDATTGSAMQDYCCDIMKP